MNIFVDVDDTLVLFTNSTSSINPYGFIRGKPYEPNTKLIEKLRKVDTSIDHIIVWSGGGKEYARRVAREVLVSDNIKCTLASKFEDFSQIKPGDIVIDDQKEFYIGMEDFGVHIFSPLEDWIL